MTECVALLRGINVGRAKRIAMAELRGLVAELGFTNVRTVLNSGNVVFQSTPITVTDAALQLRKQSQVVLAFRRES